MYIKNNNNKKKTENNIYNYTVKEIEINKLTIKTKKKPITIFFKD
jgi:hypothetical protein